MNTTDLSTLSNHAINMIAIQQVQDFLSSTYVFRYNENTHRIVYKRISNDEEFHYLSDYEFNSILKDIKMANISCSRDLLRTVLFSDYVQKFNPFANYLNNLPDWDGTDYVSLLADSITTTDREYWLFCLRKWLVAMVASLKEEGVVNHTAIIFSGAQGIGKTRWFHSIIPSELQEFIYEGYIQTKDKETQVKLSECILILMDELENLSDKNISVQTREASVNGVMDDPYFSCDVASGKTANDTIYFSTKDELGTIELSFHIFDSDTFDTIADTEKVTLVIDDSITSEKTEADKIYEVNGVVVSYAGKVDDDIWGTEFQFLIENNGTETYTVRAENISIDNTMYDGSMYAEVAAGKYANETMSFIGEELPAEMNELEFKLVISNSSYETVAESDPIKVSIQ